jgi:hypothetical protein
MRIMTTVAGLAALTLGACGQGAESEKAVEAGAEATAVADPGLPKGPTPGLWRITTTMSGMPAGAAPPTMETCVREAVFERPPAPMEDMAGMDCRQEAFRREGDVIVGRSVCTMGPNMHSESIIRISGDLARRYTMEVKATQTPAPSPEMANMTMIMTAERLGDCPAEAPAA